MARLVFLKTHGRPEIRINLKEAEQWKAELGKMAWDSLAWVRHCANSGVAACEFVLAVCLYNGISAVENDAEAFVWCQRAAGQGIGGAMNVLGNLNLELRKNPSEALRWYIKAAALKEAAAIYNIGTLFERGIGVEEDMETAFDWYLRAATYGSVNAQNVMGIFHEQGISTDRNALEAILWYRFVHICFLTQDNQLTYISVEFSKSALGGHPHAQYNLARCYSQAIGVDRRSDLAMVWFQFSADQNHTLAMMSLAVSHENSIGVERDWVTARNWYLSAAERGVTEAKNRLGQVIASELLMPCRLILGGRLKSAEFPAIKTDPKTPHPKGLTDLPIELLETIMEFLNPLNILTRRQTRNLFDYARDFRGLRKESGYFIEDPSTRKAKFLEFVDVIDYSKHDCGICTGECDVIAHHLSRLNTIT